MFKHLQQKWEIPYGQSGIIFGFMGLTTAYLILNITICLGIHAGSFGVGKLLTGMGMLLLGSGFISAGYGALSGNWGFFWKYMKKLMRKLGGVRPEASGVGGEEKVKNEKSKVKSQKSKVIEKDYQLQTPNPKRQTKIAIFASGAGSNAEKIILHLKNHPSAKVALVVCNKPGAGVIEIAKKNQLPVLMIEKETFFRGNSYIPDLKSYGVDFIVLAGFLWKIPDALIAAYPQKIINIHPALLPKYGGKGMYGMKVHEAVIAAGEKESGITIHYVNEHFDEGEPIFQAKCPIDDTETPKSLAQKIHALEHRYFPEVVEKLISSR